MCKHEYDLKIIEAYNQGEDIDSIVKRYKISRSTLDRIRAKHNIKPRQKRFNPKTPKYNLDGQIFGFLKVIQTTRNRKYKSKGYVILCECLKCGKTNLERFAWDLLKGRAVSCGCYRNYETNIGSNNPKWTGYGLISGQKWASYKIAAKNRKLPFEISIEYAWKIYENQKGLCALSGMPIFFGKTNTAVVTASLDRINSSLGYIEGNIQWVHKDINRIKRNLNEARMKTLCRAVLGLIDSLEDEVNEVNSVSKMSPWSQKHIAGKHNIKFTGYEDIGGEYWSRIVCRARKTHRVLTISIEEAYLLYMEQNKRCAITGVPISFGLTTKDVSTASLDRKDSSIGYTRENVQWVHKDINNMKSDLSQDYFLELCHKICEYTALNSPLL